MCVCALNTWIHSHRPTNTLHYFSSLSQSPIIDSLYGRSLMCHLLCQLLNKTQWLCLPQNTVGYHSLQLISCANRTRNVKCKSQRLQSAQKGVWYLRYPAAQQQSVGRPVFKLWPAGKGKSQLSLRSTERIVQQQCRRDNWMLSEGWRTFVQIDGGRNGINCYSLGRDVCRFLLERAGFRG